MKMCFCPTLVFFFVFSILYIDNFLILFFIVFNMSRDNLIILFNYIYLKKIKENSTSFS